MGRIAVAYFYSFVAYIDDTGGELIKNWKNRTGFDLTRIAGITLSLNLLAQSLKFMINMSVFY